MATVTMRENAWNDPAFLTLTNVIPAVAVAVAVQFIQGFILTMIANEIATRPACDKFTYGPVRAEVLSALFSTVTILVISLLLVYFAILRLVGELDTARIGVNAPETALFFEVRVA